MSTNLSRRHFLNLATLAGASLALNSCMNDAPAVMELNEGPVKSPQEALTRLVQGNARFAQNKTVDPNQSETRRISISGVQTPFATVLSCVDSRVPPELIFDRGLGDLFVIRTAGQVLDDAVLGSIEYGVAELNIPLIMVLGHERCGAVSAAIESIDHGTTAPGSIAMLVEGIRPAVEQTAGQGGDRVDNAVRANVQLIAARLATSPIISSAISSGKLQIVGARYALSSGLVSVLS
jgi:carbonic anhydrase